MTGRRIQIVGGFGSAGAGNRTGRRIARLGSGQTALSTQGTATDRDMKMERKHLHPQAKLGDPTKEELQRAIEDRVCWWCGATHSKDGSEMRNWGYHYSVSHGINLQHIRDILEVPKTYPLCTPELSAKYSVTMKARFDLDPELWLGRLKQIPGKKRELSAYGRKIQVERMRKVRQQYRRDVAAGLRPEPPPSSPEHMRRMSEIRRAKQLAARVPVECLICGVLFSPLHLKGKSTRKTCGPKCHQELRMIPVRIFNRSLRKERTCTGCGKKFWLPGGRCTCSDECAERAVRIYSTCAACGKEFWIARPEGRPGKLPRKSCSSKCEFKLRSAAGKINSLKRHNIKKPERRTR